MKTKVCTKCKIEKPLEAFAKDKARKDGIKTWCRECCSVAHKKLSQTEAYKQRRKEYAKTETAKKVVKKYRQSPKGKIMMRKSKLKTKYGLTTEQHKQMYLDQNGCCAICNEAMPYDEVQTDHNHVTGKIRDLLCSGCNTLVGRIETHSERINQILEYIKKHD